MLRANERILLAARSALSYGSGVVIIAGNAKFVPEILKISFTFDRIAENSGPVKPLEARFSP